MLERTAIGSNGDKDGTVAVGVWGHNGCFAQSGGWDIDSFLIKRDARTRHA